jgi:hypothetical protein
MNWLKKIFKKKNPIRSEKNGFDSSLRKSGIYIDKNKYEPKNFPNILDEKVNFLDEYYELSKWIEMHRGSDVFTWSLPEIDNRDSYEQPEWSSFRTLNEREEIESDYLENYIKYTKIIFSYIQNGIVFLDRNQYTTAVLQTVWIKMAPKHLMLRSEFFSLSNAMNQRVQAELKKLS